MKHFGFEDDCPDPATAGHYRKKTVVRMWKINEPFECTNREGEKMQGQPGDFLVEDGYGGFYPVGAEFHEKNYQSTG